MRVGDAGNTERAGLHTVGLVVEKDLGWIFRDQPQADFGIDAQIEIVDGSRATGQLVAVQIKAGSSYFSEENDSGFVYRGEKRHLEYWLNHSLPVVVALVDPGANVYWQAVTTHAVQETARGWKMTVPREQVLGASSRDALLSITPGRTDPGTVLTLAVPLMRHVNEGGRVVVEASEWINKSSGRGSIHVVMEHADGSTTPYDWPHVYFPYQSYEDVLAKLFPWAEFHVDEDFYEDYERSLYEAECGCWDSEDNRYLFFTEEWEEWRSGLPRFRPYRTVSGEVALYRLGMSLNDVGRSFLAADALPIQPGTVSRQEP